MSRDRFGEPTRATSHSDGGDSTSLEEEDEVFLYAIDLYNSREDVHEESCLTANLNNDHKEEKELKPVNSHRKSCHDVNKQQVSDAAPPVTPFFDCVPERERSISFSPLRNVQRRNVGHSSNLSKRLSRSRIKTLPSNSLTNSATKLSTRTSVSTVPRDLIVTPQQTENLSPGCRMITGNRQKSLSESCTYPPLSDELTLSELFSDLDVTKYTFEKYRLLGSEGTTESKYDSNHLPTQLTIKTGFDGSNSSLHDRTVSKVHRNKIISPSNQRCRCGSDRSTSPASAILIERSVGNKANCADGALTTGESATPPSLVKDQRSKEFNRSESVCPDYFLLRRGSAPTPSVASSKISRVIRSNSSCPSNQSDPTRLIERATILEAVDKAFMKDANPSHRRLSVNMHATNSSLNRLGFATEHCLSPTELHLSLLPEDDKNRFVNKKAVDIAMPKSFSTVLRWCCRDKEKNESFLEYFSRHNYSRSKIKKIFHFENSTLTKLEQSHTSELFDVSVLFSLIRIGCEIHEKKFPQTDMKALHQALKEAKQLRNGVIHEPRGAAISPNTFVQVRRSLMKLIKRAGQIFSVTLMNLNVERMRIVQEMELIMSITSKEERLIRTQWKFRTEAWQESKMYWDELQTQYIPFSDEKVNIGDIYHPLYLRLKKDSTLNTTRENLVSLDDVLEPPPKDAKIRKVTVVEGEVGSGKSTAIINFGLQFYGQIPLKIETLNAYDLLYIIECRNQTHKTFEDYICRSFPRTCKSLEVNEVIQSMFNLNNLFFIDGYDEINKNSQRVVLDIINIIKTWPHTRVVFTMRPFASSKFCLMMRNEGLSFESCSLVDIMTTDSQILFLERYVNARKTRNLDLVNTFRSLPESLKVFFQSPINLVLFYHLHGRSPDAVQYWSDESDILKEIYDLFHVMIRNKMNALYIDNFSVILDDIMDETCLLAFECLLTDKMTLDEKFFVAFTKRCILRGVRKLPYDQVLSNIFITKRSHPPYSETYYQFYHKSVQEYLASISLLKMLKHNKMTTKKAIRMFAFENRRLLHSQNEEGGLATFDSNDDFSKLENMLILALIQLTRNDGQDHGQDFDRIREVVRLLPAPEDNDHPYDILYARLDRDFEARNFYYWSKLMVRCRYHPVVVATVAELVSWDTVLWGDEDLPLAPLSTSNAPRLLFGGKFLQTSGNPKQPTKVFMCPPPTKDIHADLPPVLHELLMKMEFRGKLFLSLNHSHNSFTPCDEVLSHLQGSRCLLKHFQGCLARSDSLEALGNVLASDVRLDISLAKLLPLNLEKLQGTDHFIRVTLQCDAEEELPVGGSQLALPRSSFRPPELRLVGIPANAWERVRDVVISLTPHDKSLYAVELPRCGLSDDELEKIIESLTDERVNTERGSWCYVDSTWRSDPTLDGHTRDVELFLRRR